MTRHSARSRGVPIAVAALPALAAFVVACVQGGDGSRGAKRAAGDSAAGAVYVGEAKPGAPSPSPDSYGPDSATPVRGFGPTEIEAALRTDSTHTPEVIDSSAAATPSGADLDVLRREIGLPVAGVTAAALRDSYDERRGGTRAHEALDIPAPRGTPVLSAASGRVLKLFTSKAGGLMVYAADSSGRFILMYGHLDAYQAGLAEGQALSRGQPIGTVGTTGNAPPTVPHLHFAVVRSADVRQWWTGRPVNPYPLLR